MVFGATWKSREVLVEEHLSIVLLEFSGFYDEYGEYVPRFGWFIN